MAVDPRVAQVMGLIRAGKKAEAQPIIAAMLKADPNNADYWFIAAGAANGTQKQIELLDRALAINPNHANARSVRAKLTATNELDSLFGSPAENVSPAVAAAQAKDYTNAVIICVVLYFVLWIPGVIANNIYYNEGRRMEELAGHELPGVATLGTLKRVMFMLFILGILGYFALLVFMPRF